jgi:maltose alpha-D-glucosyltransferase/alpha-amylase
MKRLPAEMTSPNEREFSQSPAWLSEAVFYQIYPQSFRDANGDGFGDLKGIETQLDYIRRLGATVIWLNPCFDSPFGDAGYDVRDFYKVAPRYGSEADLIRLFEKAHAMGLKVVLDLVAGHTSMDHPWFAYEAANPKVVDANRYIWKNRDFDLANGPTRDDFVGNFFWYQPALNYGYAEPVEAWQDPVDAPGPKRNREELRRIMAYWFDRGCDGFRVDMAGSLVKPESHPKALEETVKLWQEIRLWLDVSYPDRILLAEWSRPAVAIQAGFHVDFWLHFNTPGYPSLFFNGVGSLPPSEGTCYFHRDGQGSLALFRPEYQRQLKVTRGKGYFSLPVSNHDLQRLRCGPRTENELRCAWVFFLTQAGPPTIYYGEEIGMRYWEDCPPREGSTLVGITAVNAGTTFGERSGSRTPMQWDQSPNAGFSTAAPENLYLPLDPDPSRTDVASQELDPTSLLNFVRRLLALRREHPALSSDADYTILNPENVSYPMVVLREHNGQSLLIAINPSETKRELPLPIGGFSADMILNGGCRLTFEGRTLNLTVDGFGYGLVALRRAGAGSQTNAFHSAV